MLTTTVAAALQRLNGLLPLKARQDRLPPSLRQMHVAILRGYAARGAAPSREDLALQVGDEAADAALQRLAKDDLIVLTPDRTAIIGAYPFTSEARVHCVTLNGYEVHAMCALDALSIAPMFVTETRVRSRCHVHGTPIGIHMRGGQVLTAIPADVHVGIRWQGTSGCAAQSLCLEMLFLRDRATVEAWRQADPENIDVFTLPEAIAFGAAFFQPLLADAG